MKRRISIYFLVFSLFLLVAEMIEDFDHVKLTYYSINFNEHFVVKRFYDIDSWRGSEYKTRVVEGYLEYSNTKRYLTVAEEHFQRNSQYDGEKSYFDVWYNQETKRIFIKQNEKGEFLYNGLFFIIIWLLCIPTIIYLIKIKNNNRNEKSITN
jgi:hypothetical protein